MGGALRPRNKRTFATNEYPPRATHEGTQRKNRCTKTHERLERAKACNTRTPATHQRPQPTHARKRECTTARDAQTSATHERPANVTRAQTLAPTARDAQTSATHEGPANATRAQTSALDAHSFTASLTQRFDQTLVNKSHTISEQSNNHNAQTHATYERMYARIVTLAKHERPQRMNARNA